MEARLNLSWSAPEQNLGNTLMPACRPQAAFAVLVTAVALAACGSVEDALIERGLPPAYAEGYADGCASGKEVAGGLFAKARKDASRYDTNSQYAQGWNEGFEECRRDTAAMVRDARLRNPSRNK